MTFSPALISRRVPEYLRDEAPHRGVGELAGQIEVARYDLDFEMPLIPMPAGGGQQSKLTHR